MHSNNLYRRYINTNQDLVFDKTIWELQDARSKYKVKVYLIFLTFCFTVTLSQVHDQVLCDSIIGNRRNEYHPQILLFYDHKNCKKCCIIEVFTDYI